MAEKETGKTYRLVVMGRSVRSDYVAHAMDWREVDGRTADEVFAYLMEREKEEFADHKVDSAYLMAFPEGIIVKRFP